MMMVRFPQYYATWFPSLETDISTEDEDEEEDIEDEEYNYDDDYPSKLLRALPPPTGCICLLNCFSSQLTNSLLLYPETDGMIPTQILMASTS